MCLLTMKDEIKEVIKFKKGSLMNIPLDNNVEEGRLIQ